MTTNIPTSLLLAGGIAAVLATACATVFVVILRFRRRPDMPATARSSAMDSDQLGALAGNDMPPSIPTATEAAWPSAPLPENGISGEWCDFVSQRLDELDPKEHQDETKWALGVIDFLDELKEADAESSPSERDRSTALRQTLVARLAAKGFAPVDSGEWNPDLQRAVAVVRKPDAAGTIIFGKGATGLSRDGKIIRKQEVKIETKGT